MRKSAVKLRKHLSVQSQRLPNSTIWKSGGRDDGFELKNDLAQKRTLHQKSCLDFWLAMFNSGPTDEIMIQAKDDNLYFPSIALSGNLFTENCKKRLSTK